MKSKVVRMDGKPFRRRKINKDNVIIGRLINDLDALNKQGKLKGVIVGLVINDGTTARAFAVDNDVVFATALGSIDLAKEFFLESYARASDIPLNPNDSF